MRGLAPVKRWARISEYYAAALGADAGYTGVLTHNPMEAAQLAGFKTHWLRREPYTLGELAEFIPFRWRRPKPSRTAAGRNMDVFATACAGRARRRISAWRSSSRPTRSRRLRGSPGPAGSRRHREERGALPPPVDQARALLLEGPADGLGPGAGHPVRQGSPQADAGPGPGHRPGRRIRPVHALHSSGVWATP